MTDKIDPLALLRKPFEPHQIAKLPKPTAEQTKVVKEDYKKGHRCKVCGSWHHPDVVHLDYVGHAALTDRLLDADPHWSWEPVAFNDQGLPAFDPSGGLWIRLTVAGVSRLGYGHAASKSYADPGSREKEVIGDALRNAAMRFGAALDLWHKGQLHLDEGEDAPAQEPAKAEAKKAPTLTERAERLIGSLQAAADTAALEKAWALGSKLCADLDLSDPDTLATVTLAYEVKRDELSANPFERAA